MNKIAVTGATGFIGKHVCRNLELQGMPYVRLVRNPELSNDRFYDLSQKQIESNLLDGIETLVHIAAYVHKKDIKNLFEKYNVNSSKLLFDLAAKKKVNVIFISTVGVYGKVSSDCIITESDPIKPLNNYSFSKYRSELDLKKICKNTDLSFSIFRLPLVIGSNAPGTYGLLEKLILKVPFIPFKGCKSLRSVLSVDIFSEFLVNQLYEKKFFNKAVIVKNINDVSVANMVKNICISHKKKCVLFYIPQVFFLCFFKFFKCEKLYYQLFESLRFKASVELKD